MQSNRISNIYNYLLFALIRHLVSPLTPASARCMMTYWSIYFVQLSIFLGLIAIFNFFTAQIEQLGGPISGQALRQFSHL